MSPNLMSCVLMGYTADINIFHNVGTSQINDYALFDKIRVDEH